MFPRGIRPDETERTHNDSHKNKPDSLADVGTVECQRGLVISRSRRGQEEQKGGDGEVHEPGHEHARDDNGALAHGGRGKIVPSINIGGACRYSTIEFFYRNRQLSQASYSSHHTWYFKVQYYLDGFVETKT